MLIREYFPELGSWKINLLATDLSQIVLDRAKQGIYSQIEVNRGLPAAMLIKYFQQHGTSWHLKPEIRNLVQFRELNLAQPWPYLPPMDLILMRNVLIYFDADIKKTILGRISRLLEPDGYLLLGAAETTLFLDPSYQRVQHMQTGFYKAG
jgi:chemotaxis protein methyltransferase CheR